METKTYKLTDLQRLSLDNANLRVEIAGRDLHAAQAVRNSEAVAIFTELGIPEEDHPKWNVNLREGTVHLKG